MENNVVKVESINPAPVNTEIESVAQKQEKQSWFKKWQEKRQIKIDDKIFEQIRNTLVEKAFGRNKKEVNNYYKQIAQLERDIEKGKNNQRFGLADRVDDYYNVARGAQITERKEKIDQWQTIATSAMGALPVEYLLSLIAPSVVAFPGIGTAIAGVGAIVSIAIAIIKKRMSKKGNRSDSRQKDESALKEIKEIVDKIVKFCKEIDKDKSALIEKKKTMKKEDFDKYLNEYLSQKADFLKELGIEDCLNTIRNEVEGVTEEKQQQKTSSNRVALAGA